MKRFATGLSHFVFEVTTTYGMIYVVRIAFPARKGELEAGLYWHRLLATMGLPLPALYQTGVMRAHPFAIYERLPGDDLEALYSTLTSRTKQHIAHTVANIQKKARLLDKSAFPKTPPAWQTILEIIVRRSEREILRAAQFDPVYVAYVRELIHRYAGYFETIEPVAFLHDLNVRNVIVHQEAVAGVIDVDEVWYGDPLLSIGRGKSLLLTAQQKSDYIDYWCSYIGLSDMQLKMVDLYALLYCIRFMGTSGLQLNGNDSLQTDARNAPRLETVAQELLQVL